MENFFKSEKVAVINLQKRIKAGKKIGGCNLCSACPFL